MAAESHLTLGGNLVRTGPSGLKSALRNLFEKSAMSRVEDVKEIRGEQTQETFYYVLNGTGPVPNSPTEEQFDLENRPGGGYTLPEGESFGERGYGWEHIDAQTSLSQGDLYEAVNNQVRVERRAGYTVIVGYAGDRGHVAVWLHDDTIVAATADEDAPSPYAG